MFSYSFLQQKSLPIKREGGSITKWVFGVSNLLSFLFVAKTNYENAIIGPTNFGAHIAHKSFDQQPEQNILSFSRPIFDEKWSNIPNSATTYKGRETVRLVLKILFQQIFEEIWGYKFTESYLFLPRVLLLPI